jgi:hypothetical protein
VLSTWGSFIYGDPVIVHTRHKPERMLQRIQEHSMTDRVLLGEIGCVRSPYDMTFGESLKSLLRILAVFVKAMFFKLFKLRPDSPVSLAKAGRKLRTIFLQIF